MQSLKTKLLRADVGSGLCLRCHDDSTACVPYLSPDYISLRRHAVLFCTCQFFVFFFFRDKLSRTTAKAESRRRTSEEASAAISRRVRGQK